MSNTLSGYSSVCNSRHYEKDPGWRRSALNPFTADDMKDLEEITLLARGVYIGFLFAKGLASGL